MTFRLIDGLRRNHRARRAYLALRTVAAVQPAHRFVFDLATNRSVGTYRARRTGQLVSFRPRLDLQVAREQLTRSGYSPPPEVSTALGDFHPRRVLDLGANIGFFTLSVLARDVATHVVAVEPDPDNLAILRRNLDQNSLGASVEIVAAAAGTEVGQTRFAAGFRELGHVTDSPDGIAVDEVDFFDLASGCDHIKMDIEGGEWAILRDPRLADLGASTLVMEWHHRNAGVDDPAIEAERLLRTAGYQVVHCGREGGRVGELWAYRPTP